MFRGLYTLAMNVYLADFCSWIMVYLANFVGVQILANPNDVVHLVYRTVHECQGHSLYCHLNASHLNAGEMQSKITKLEQKPKERNDQVSTYCQ